MCIYVCNACNYIFRSGEQKKIRCPHCDEGIVISDLDTNRKVIRAAVRPATSAEITFYENANSSEPISRDLGERIDYLTSLQLSDEEHNLALVLLYYLNTEKEQSSIQTLKSLLTPRHSDVYERMAQTTCDIEYRIIIKQFTEDFERDRHTFKINDTKKVAEQAGKGSAAAVLLHFRSSWMKPNRKVPNLATIREIEWESVAKEPSYAYTEFLLDLYNSTVGGQIERNTNNCVSIE